MRPTERPRETASLTDAEVADWIEARTRCALLFWDEADDASRRQRARLEVVAASAEIPLAVVDIRRDAVVAQALGVTSVPTLVVFRDGEVMERVIGGAPEAILREALR